MTTGPLPLSVFIITLDEADRLGPVLAAARRLSDDVVVVDSGSTDGTQDLAASHGARVVHRAFDGYGAQKRFAQSLCRHLWVLALDADEVPGEDAIAEIRSLFATGEPPLDAYVLHFAETFPIEDGPRPWAHCNDFVRLYRAADGAYSLSPVHDVVDMKPGARIGTLRARIDHHSIRSLGDQLAKLNRYTDRQVDDLDARGKRLSAIRLPFEFVAGFLKAYVWRRHFLSGAYGFMVAMNYGFYRYLRVAKHVERRLLKRAGKRAGG